MEKVRYLTKFNVMQFNGHNAEECYKFYHSELPEKIELDKNGVQIMTDYNDEKVEKGDYLFDPNDTYGWVNDNEEQLIRVSEKEFERQFEKVPEYDEAVELLLAELKKQDRKGFTTEFDCEINNKGQLLRAISLLLMECDEKDFSKSKENDFLVEICCPSNWNKDLWIKLLNKSNSEKLIIIASFAIKEWKRLKVIETNGDI